jgi:hypothetical protein
MTTRRYVNARVGVIEDNASTADELMSNIRTSWDLCPKHGCYLVPAPMEHVSAPVQKKCPEFGCAYKKHAR